MVSEYPFKQNKNMLKSMTVLSYTIFYNISLNVLRPTFFNIYNLSFLFSPNIGKIRIKVRPKTDNFPIFWAPAPTELLFSMIFFHWHVANQETNKTVPAIYFFPQYFLNNLLLTVFMQNTLSKLIEPLQSKMNNSLLRKTQARFCQAIC